MIKLDDTNITSLDFNLATLNCVQQLSKYVAEEVSKLEEQNHDDDDKIKKEKRNSLEWHRNRILDCDGELAEAMEKQIRDGDIRSEGVIWPHLAEISLLGGLGCGSKLIELVLRELSKPTSIYEYVSQSLHLFIVF